MSRPHTFVAPFEDDQTFDTLAELAAHLHWRRCQFEGRPFLMYTPIMLWRAGGPMTGTHGVGVNIDAPATPLHNWIVGVVLVRLDVERAREAANALATAMAGFPPAEPLAERAMA